MCIDVVNILPSFLVHNMPWEAARIHNNTRLLQIIVIRIRKTKKKRVSRLLYAVFFLIIKTEKE